MFLELSMQKGTVMSGRGATMTAVTRRTKKRAVMRRRWAVMPMVIKTIFTCDLFDILLLFVRPNTNSEALN